MTTLREQKQFYKEIYGRNPPQGKGEDWLVREYNKAQDLLHNVRQLGYNGAFEMKPIREFIRNKAISHDFRRTHAGYRRMTETLIRGNWQMESKVNPENDSAKITARYIINDDRKSFILPSNLSAEQRKEYPLLIKDQLTQRFKEQINKRVLPHLKRKDYDTVAKVRFKMELTMRNQEQKERERTVHTKQFDVRLKSGKDRNKFFKRIYEEWTVVYRIFVSENVLRNIDEDVLNPEIKMNREDYNDEDSWNSWSIYSIKSMTVEIQFPFSKNNSTHVAQVMKGPIETYIEDRLVSSEEWRENHYDEKEEKEEKEEQNPKYSQPRYEDGNNKRKKAVARSKHKKRGGFYFEPPEFIKNSKSGCICIDNKNEYCLKYANACAEHFKDCHREHPRRHQQYEKYFDEHNYKRMNFPVGYNDLEKFHKDNPNTILKIYGVKGVSKHTTKIEHHQKMFPFYFPTLTPA